MIYCNISNVIIKPISSLVLYYLAFNCWFTLDTLMIFVHFFLIYNLWKKTKCRNISGLDEGGEEEAGWFQNGGPSPWARGTGKGNKSDNCCTCLDRNSVCLPLGFCGLFREGPDLSVFSIRSVCPARLAVLFPGGCLDLNVSIWLSRSGNQLVQTSGLKPTQTAVFSAL